MATKPGMTGNDDKKTCSTCGGSGTVQDIAMGMLLFGGAPIPFPKTCTGCGGSGKV